MAAPEDGTSRRVAVAAADDEPFALAPQGPAPCRDSLGRRTQVWLFDLDNTLHDAGRAVFRHLDASMTCYIERELALDRASADHLRSHYWKRYGATLLGLMRHHGVRAEHFLHHTHLLPGLESQVRTHAHDRHALARLPGRKFILTNAPLAYAERVLGALDLAHLFEGVIAIEQMRVFGQLRPKPDARMFRRVLARLGVQASRCVLVEDTLAHQRAAHRLGIRAVWMQRWTRRNAHGPEVGARLRRRPEYVYAKIAGLKQLKRLR
jgi:putative hydrolase of the HAD superfamily